MHITCQLERKALFRELSRIFSFTQIGKIYGDKYEADIAIFVLSSKLYYIRSVNDVPADDVPRLAFTNALNALHCLTMDSYLAFLSSTRTCCGTGGDGSRMEDFSCFLDPFGFSLGLFQRYVSMLLVLSMKIQWLYIHKPEII